MSVYATAVIPKLEDKPTKPDTILSDMLFELGCTRESKTPACECHVDEDGSGSEAQFSRSLSAVTMRVWRYGASIEGNLDALTTAIYKVSISGSACNGRWYSPFT